MLQNGCTHKLFLDIFRRYNDTTVLFPLRWGWRLMLTNYVGIGDVVTFAANESFILCGADFLCELRRARDNKTMSGKIYVAVFVQPWVSFPTFLDFNGHLNEWILIERFCWDSRLRIDKGYLKVDATERPRCIWLSDKIGHKWWLASDFARKKWTQSAVMEVNMIVSDSSL